MKQPLIMIKKNFERLAKLAGGVAVIKVGGAKKLRLKKEKTELKMH